MLETIMKWESKGFRFCITPQQDKGKWYWVAGVYIGMERRADWVSKPDCPIHAGYETYEGAFNALLDYCENYKVKKKK